MASVVPSPLPDRRRVIRCMSRLNASPPNDLLYPRHQRHGVVPTAPLHRWCGHLPQLFSIQHSRSVSLCCLFRSDHFSPVRCFPRGSGHFAIAVIGAVRYLLHCQRCMDVSPLPTSCGSVPSDLAIWPSQSSLAIHFFRCSRPWVRPVVPVPRFTCLICDSPQRRLTPMKSVKRGIAYDRVEN
jgi:hypothetical protein